VEIALASHKGAIMTKKKSEENFKKYGPGLDVEMHNVWTTDCGGGGIKVSGSGTTLKMTGGGFRNNGGPDIAGDRIEELSLDGVSFSDAKKTEPTERKKSRYFGGFSFSKGDHLDGK
jgi:hypothetical protein